MPVSRRCWFLFASLVLLPALSAAQNINGAITGVVRDSSHAVVPDAALTLRDVGKDQIVATAVSGADGEYAFRNLAPARYEVTATKDGFRQVVLPGIDVTLSSVQRLDVELPVGTQTERVEVVGGSSVLSTTGTQEHGISPETLGQLPLIMNSGPRVFCKLRDSHAGRQHGRRRERVRRADQRRPAVGRRGHGRRRQHAAGLHEPGRDGLDLPGLSDVARHGERGEGPDVELCPRVRLVAVGADHGGDEVGRQQLPRRRVRIPPR